MDRCRVRSLTKQASCSLASSATNSTNGRFKGNHSFAFPGTLAQAETFVASKETTMSDDKLNRVQPDRSKINMSEDYEVHYWTKHLNVSRDVLQRAVDKVGNSAAAVRKELGSSIKSAAN